MSHTIRLFVLVQRPNVLISMFLFLPVLVFPTHPRYLEPPQAERALVRSEFVREVLLAQRVRHAASQGRRPGLLRIRNLFELVKYKLSDFFKDVGSVIVAALCGSIKPPRVFELLVLTSPRWLGLKWNGMFYHRQPSNFCFRSSQPSLFNRAAGDCAHDDDLRENHAPLVTVLHVETQLPPSSKSYTPRSTQREPLSPRHPDASAPHPPRTSCRREAPR